MLGNFEQSNVRLWWLNRNETSKISQSLIIDVIFIRFRRSMAANYKELTISVSSSIGEHAELTSFPTNELCFVLPNQQKQLARGLKITKKMFIISET